MRLGTVKNRENRRGVVPIERENLNDKSVYQEANEFTKGVDYWNP